VSRNAQGRVEKRSKDVVMQQAGRGSDAIQSKRRGVNPIQCFFWVFIDESASCMGMLGQFGVSRELTRKAVVMRVRGR
jgi:hypothetical protein